MTLALFVYLLAIVCWLGAIIFFSFFTAPVLFARLAVADAGNVVAGIFPRYYALGYVAGAVATALAAYFAMVRGARPWWSAAAVLLGLALLVTLYAGLVVRPKIDSIRTAARDPQAAPAGKAEFDRLHRLSVILNGTVLILNLGALAASARGLAHSD
jgi:p-aminobenzoyl-glutamate transporter AbgT